MRLSKNWYFEFGERVFVDTSVLLRCYYAFVLPILEYCSPVWESAAESHLQLLERQVYSVVRLCPHQTFLLVTIVIIAIVITIVFVTRYVIEINTLITI